MQRRKPLIAGAVVLTLTLTVAGTAFASSTNFFRFFRSDKELSEEQQAIVDQYEKDMDDLTSKFIEDAIGSGIITEDEAADIEKWADKWNEWQAEKPLEGNIEGNTGDDTDATNKLPGFNFGSKWRANEGIAGLGFDLSKLTLLTEEQKEQLNKINEERTAIDKEYIEKAVTVGIITRVQANSLLDMVEKETKAAVTEEAGESTETAKPAKGHRVSFGIGSRTSLLFGVFSIDEDKLNDEQKAVVEGYHTAFKSLSDKSIDLLVEFGIITTEKATELKDGTSLFDFISNGFGIHDFGIKRFGDGEEGSDLNIGAIIQGLKGLEGLDFDIGDFGIEDVESIFNTIPGNSNFTRPNLNRGTIPSDETENSTKLQQL